MITASNGRQALDLLMDAQPDAILMDVMMPVLDGREALRRIREMFGAGRGPAVIMMSAVPSFRLHQPDDIVCLSKPFDIDDLLAVVTDVMGRQRTAAEHRLISHQPRSP